MLFTEEDEAARLRQLPGVVEIQNAFKEQVYDPHRVLYRVLLRLNIYWLFIMLRAAEHARDGDDRQGLCIPESAGQ